MSKLTMYNYRSDIMFHSFCTWRNEGKSSTIDHARYTENADQNTIPLDAQYTLPKRRSS